MVALPTTDQAISIEDRLTTTAERLDVDRVEQYRLNLYKVRKEGVLVTLTAHGFTMFTVKAGWMELGIPIDDVRARQFSRGDKHLIPRRFVKALRSLESRFRHTFRSYSMDITGFRPYRYLTYEAYADWKEAMEELQGELDALKGQILEQYDDIRADLTEDFTQIAHEAWDALISRQGGDPDNAVLKLNEEIFSDREAFTTHVVERVLDRLPSADQIEHGIRIVYKYSLMLNQEDIAQDEYLAEYWRARAAEQKARTAYADEQAEARRRLALDEEASERRLMMAEEEKERRLILAEAEEKELEVQERRLRAEAAKEAILAEIQEQLASTIDPAVEVILKNRAELNESLQGVVASIKRNGYLHGKTAESLRIMIRNFRYFQEFDAEAAAEVNSLEEALARRVPHPDKKNTMTYDVDAIRDRAEELVILTREAAQAVSADLIGTRAGALML